MKKILYAFILLTTGTLLNACHQQEEEATDRSWDSLHLPYLDALSTDSLSSPDQLNAVKKIVKDDMIWWGIQMICHEDQKEENCIQRNINNIKLAEEWCHRQKDNPFIKGKILNKKGIVHIYNHNNQEAVHCFQQALQAFKEAHAYEEVAATYVNIANACYYDNQITEAAENYKRVTFLQDSLQSTRYLSTIHTGLAQINIDLKNYIFAQKHLDVAQEHLSEGSVYDHYYYYLTRGTCYYYQKEYKMAFASLSMGFKHACAIDTLSALIYHASLGEIAVISGQKELAISHIKECDEYLQTHPDIENKTIKFYIASLVADVYMSTGNMQKAEEIIQKLPDEKDVRLVRYLALYYTRRSSHAEQYKEYDKAFEFLKMAHHYKDSIYNDNVINNLLAIEKCYQENTNMLRNNYLWAGIKARTSRNQLRLWGIIGGLSVFLLAMSITIIVIRRRNEHRYHSQMDKISKLRMDVVRNRVSPHFVFNVLGLMLPKFKSSPELQNLADPFINLLRGSLIASNEMSVGFREEVQLVKGYVDVYHKTTGDYPQVVWHDATNGEADTVHVPTMCLQIPIENALKHAFTELTPETRIDVYMMTENERLMIRVVDNGQGYNPGKIVATGRDTGTGLRVLSRTIDLLNKKNAEPIFFSIRNLSNDGRKGTEVKISIPFRYRY